MGLFGSVRCFVDWAEVGGGGLGGSTPLLLKLVLVTLNITSLLEKDQVDSGVTSMHIMSFLQRGGFHSALESAMVKGSEQDEYAYIQKHRANPCMLRFSTVDGKVFSLCLQVRKQFMTVVSACFYAQFSWILSWSPLGSWTVHQKGCHCSTGGQQFYDNET